MCNKFISIFVLSVLLLITGCSSNTAKEDTITTNLKIATIGAPPSLNADQVKFENIQLEDLKRLLIISLEIIMLSLLCLNF